jgi:hypothetical protein
MGYANKIAAEFEVDKSSPDSYFPTSTTANRPHRADITRKERMHMDIVLNITSTSRSRCARR